MTTKVTVDLADLCLLLDRAGEVFITSHNRSDPSDPIVGAIDRMGDQVFLARSAERLGTWEASRAQRVSETRR